MEQNSLNDDFWFLTSKLNKSFMNSLAKIIQMFTVIEFRNKFVDYWAWNEYRRMMLMETFIAYSNLDDVN